jgi:thioredoxin reductase (NADPH)
LYLAEIAQQVFQIYRGEELRGETAWIEQIKKHPKITVLTKTNVTAVDGDSVLQNIEINRPFNGQSHLAIDGLFVEIGSDPDGKLIQQLGLETDLAGYIITQADQRTSVEGVWAAGDITTNSDGFRQIVTACSEGAIAARSIFYALKKQSTA